MMRQFNQQFFRTDIVLVFRSGVFAQEAAG
jgi:hypothetical protein